MSASPEQVLQEFAEGLERARSRCSELDGAVTDARTQVEALQSETERQVAALRQEISDAVVVARGLLGSAVQEANNAADLARKLAERLAQVAGEARETANGTALVVEQLGSAFNVGATNVGAAAAAAVEQAQQAGETGQQTFEVAEKAFSERLGGRSQELLGTLGAIASDSSAAITASMGQISAASDRDATEKARSTIDNLSSSMRELAVNVSNSTESHHNDSQTNIDEHGERWSAQFSDLASNARSFSGGVAAVGEDVLGIARAMTESADTVTDAMEVTNVGLRTVVGIFDNMQTIMDDIISFA